MAVRIDIRPRLTLPEEHPVRSRRRFQLPPLALPAAAYWVAMGGLTYFFAQVGDNPFESAHAASAEAGHAFEPAPAEPAPEPNTIPSPAPHGVPGEAPAAEPRAEALEPEEGREEPAADDYQERAPSDGRAEQEADSAERRVARTWRPREEQQQQRHADEHTERPLPRADRAAPALSFPEFSDSSRPQLRERAADGPRIEGLFERREEPVAPRAPSAAAAPERATDAPTVAGSCEAAVARNNETIELGAPRGPADVTREAYASILQGGRYLADCSIPERTVFEICAAVKHGRAVGITVSSNPANPSLNACVRRAVSRLKFPESPRLDVTHTRFGAAR